MATKSSDPTKNPEFQKVVKHFLTTPPQPHKPLGEKPKKSGKPLSQQKSKNKA
jgi:hypothetical protein